MSNPPITMKLYKHQLDAFEQGKDRNLLLHHDCGTGKTATALSLILYHWMYDDSPALVVCPKSIIHAAWLEDAAKFAPELSVVSLWAKSGKHKAAEQKRLLSENHDVYVANFETFKTLYFELWAKRFKVIIVDESSKMKDHTTDITRALLSLAGVTYRTRGGKGYLANYTIPHRYCLSGTPAPNNEMEYWPQVKFVEGATGCAFPTNFYAFRNTYFYNVLANVYNGQMQKWVIKKEMEAEFNNRLKEVSHVVRKQDAIDLPEQTYENRIVQLSDAERKPYNEMRQELMIEFGNDVVLANNALSKIMKLRQLTSGFCYGADGQTYRTGRTKLNELKSLLEEIGNQQVIIWANFKAEIQDLLTELPGSKALWSENADREEAIKSFQDGKTQYLIANPMSAAHGLTFVNCCYAVYYSMNYSYELQKQSEDRIHRIGQNKKCTYYSIIAQNTVDELIHKAVNKKADLNKTILEHLKNGDQYEGTTSAKGFAKAAV